LNFVDSHGYVPDPAKNNELPLVPCSRCASLDISPHHLGELDLIMKVIQGDARVDMVFIFRQVQKTADDAEDGSDVCVACPVSIKYLVLVIRIDDIWCTVRLGR